MAAGMYPMACIIYTVILCIFIRPVFTQKWLSMEELVQKVNEIRAKGPTPTNRPNEMGPLSIDPVRPEHIQNLINMHRRNGE